ncbi:hypothetical protein B0H11DRAFT_2230804 [Mycena galericulata]|nr:hypothetical protein B0H11DRAFT_2230804 [Mycena galericulata]
MNQNKARQDTGAALGKTFPWAVYEEGVLHGTPSRFFFQTALHCGGKRSVATILHRAPSGSSSNTISTFELLRPGDTTRVAPRGSAQIDSNRRRTYARRDKDIRVPVHRLPHRRIQDIPPTAVGWCAAANTPAADIDSNRRRTYARRDKDIRVPVRPIDESKISFQCMIDSNRRRTCARRDKDIRVPVRRLPHRRIQNIPPTAVGWCAAADTPAADVDAHFLPVDVMDTAADPCRSPTFTTNDAKDVRRAPAAGVRVFLWLPTWTPIFPAGTRMGEGPVKCEDPEGDTNAYPARVQSTSIARCVPHFSPLLSITCTAVEAHVAGALGVGVHTVSTPRRMIPRQDHAPRATPALSRVPPVAVHAGASAHIGDIVRIATPRPTRHAAYPVERDTARVGRDRYRAAYVMRPCRAARRASCVVRSDAALGGGETSGAACALPIGKRASSGARG